ncbi:MAG: TrkH family potassium uptake protein [Lachnospirales bacterium]
MKSEIKRAAIRLYEKILTFDTPKSLVFGFIIIIFFGAFLLALPFASKNGESVGLVNALFTSTSAVCVTGLVVVNTLAHWTLFGKVVILALIQIGGISFMSIVVVFFVLTGKRLTIKDRLLIKESYNQNSSTGMVTLVINIIKGTIIIETIGAILLFSRFYLDGDNVILAMAKGIFISISAFCNAGFDVIGGNSLMPYVGDGIVNFTVMALIVIGGIGFAVWLDIKKISKVFKKEIRFDVFIRRLSLHTKIVLLVTSVLIISGFLFTFVVEYNNPNTLGPLSFGDKIWASMFQSVTLRTAGFNTLDLTKLTDSSKLFYILQMFVGGSPGGTAGGVKTVTIGVVFIGIISAVRGDNNVAIFKRSIGVEVLLKSLAVLMMNITAITVATMVLAGTTNNPSITFLDLLFESASAVGTVGLTLGVTPSLGVIGKITIILCMFLGRLGPVTLAVAFTMRAGRRKSNIKYPMEKVIVG